MGLKVSTFYLLAVTVHFWRSELSNFLYIKQPQLNKITELEKLHTEVKPAAHIL